MVTHTVSYRLAICMLLTSLSPAAHSASAPTTPFKSDAYLAGYAQALLTTQYALPAQLVTVENGIVYLTPHKTFLERDAHLKSRVIEKLKAIPGVTGVMVVENGKHFSPPDTASPKQPLATKQPLEDGILAAQSIFKPLLADPKWPRFTLAYQYQTKNRLARHVFAPNFGATFPFYRNNHSFNDGQLEFGVQAGLFGAMDIGKTPTALLNADYMVGAFSSYHWDGWSHLLRFFHISSHLGDEFMLTPAGRATRRINLSYETLGYLLSYEFKNGLRLYGGGSYMVHREPSSLKPGGWQAGTEYRHPTCFWGNHLRPIAGVDMKFNQEALWKLDWSAKLGVQVENARSTKNVVQITLEFYHGRSMHGQFYRDRIRYVGLGIHVFL